MQHRIEHKAPRGHFVTLDQLAAFVQEAMRAGADGATVVEGTISFGGKLQRVAIDTNDTPKEK